MSETQSQVTCVACSIFRNEIETLRKRGDIDFPVRYLDSMLHMRPSELCRRLNTLLEKLRDASSTVFLVYGECHNHMSEFESDSGVRRVEGCNCVEILLGSVQYRTLSREGAFFLLPEWTLRWREVFEKELGLTEKIAKDFMREMHTKLLYLDTGRMALPKECLEEASETLGLPWEAIRVGPEHLLTNIRKTLGRDYNS